MHENEISERIIGCCIRVHRALGPGLLEKAYEECLAAEMDAEGLRYERQKMVPLIYGNRRIARSYKVDFLVESKVVVELKALNSVPSVACHQVLTYLRLLDKRLGLLINFHVTMLKDGIRRVVNNLR